MKRKRKAPVQFLPQSVTGSQEQFRLVPPGATCFVCGGTDESELQAESPIYPDVYVHSSCCDAETAVSWYRAREQEDPRYKRYRISHSIEVEVICGTCQTRHWLYSRSVGMAAGNWPTHCTQCYRLGKTFSEFDPQTREYVGGRLQQLEWQFHFEGLTPEIEATMQAFAAQYDKHTNPQPCLCGGQFSIAAKPRCKHCGQVLYDTYFNFAVPPKAHDFAYQAFPPLPGRPQSPAPEGTPDINTPDIYGQTALSKAISPNNQSVVQALLDSGALVDHQDKRGWTALMWAAAQGHLEIVRTLLTRGADVNKQNRGGRTALMMAASEGHVEIVQTLLTHGAEVNNHDRDGWTALQWANEWERTTVVQALREAGAQE